MINECAFQYLFQTNKNKWQFLLLFFSISKVEKKNDYEYTHKFLPFQNMYLIFK